MLPVQRESHGDERDTGHVHGHRHRRERTLHLHVEPRRFRVDGDAYLHVGGESHDRRYGHCGKPATAMWSVTVSEGSGGGGNLTGMWSGTLYDPIGNPFSLQL